MDYYKILGLQQGASITEIKKAYRIKAKASHPDVNSAVGAKEEFIKINEAYEYLMHHKEFLNDKNTEEYYKRKEEIYKQWVSNMQNESRQKAERHADMSFKQFSKSDIYVSTFEFILFKSLGCFLTGIIVILIIIITYFINKKAAIYIFLFSMPISAFIMTVGENYISWAKIKQRFK